MGENSDKFSSEPSFTEATKNVIEKLNLEIAFQKDLLSEALQKEDFEGVRGAASKILDLKRSIFVFSKSLENKSKE